MHPALIRYAMPPRFSPRDVVLGATCTWLVFMALAAFQL
jgi:hypothetical protein